MKLEPQPVKFPRPPYGPWITILDKSWLMVALHAIAAPVIAAQRQHIHPLYNLSEET